MTPAKRFMGIFAVTAMTTFVSAAAMAHSAHDHSTVSYKWAMSKNFQAKIDSRINAANPTDLIGLNPFEQKKLEHYDINVGNKFNAELHGINFLIQRTSAGMKIVGANRARNVSYVDQVPIKQSNIFSKASMNKKSHTGHDHAHIPYEWTFDLETQNKIVRGMVQNEKNVLVGLNAFEQSLLKEYEIRTGNTFQTTIRGHQFLIESTSSGIKVTSHKELQDVAMANNNNENL